MMDLTFDGAYTYSGIHVGSHTLNGWLVRADHTKISGSDATPVSFSNVVDPADPSPPTVAITAPAGGATVSGVVPVERRCRRQRRALRRPVQARRREPRRRGPLRAVQRQLGHDDGGNGSHTLYRDRPRRGGQRDDARRRHSHGCEHRSRTRHKSAAGRRPRTLPIIPIHTSMLPNGKLLIFDSDNGTWNPRVWDPVANTFTQVPYSGPNLFCSRPHPTTRRPHPRRRGPRRRLRWHRRRRRSSTR